jgi:chloramphenicol-sensitive protein RarD
MPLYFHKLKHVSNYEILAQRILWCGLILAVVLTLTGRWPDVRRAWQSNAVRLTLFASALFLSANWLIYIHGVTSGQTVETSLGYFINPLLNVALGMVFFRERLRPLQVAALLLATLGVLNLIALAGHFPWIALSLATSFALYGVLRKAAPVDALVGLSVETFVLVIPAALGMAILAANGEVRFGTMGPATDLLLLASGVITAVPLLCFGQAARKLQLSTLGFLQYLAPTVQFLLAITVLGERELMDPVRWASFICIWIALAVYSLDTWLRLRRRGASASTTRVLPPLPAVSRTDSVA